MERLTPMLDFRHLCKTAFSRLHWSLLSWFWSRHFYVLFGWSGLCHWFRVLLWGLPMVYYQEAVVTSLVEFCSVFYIFFWNISDLFHDVGISSISPFRGKEWSNGVMCGRHLRLAIESPGHCLGVVLGSMTIFMPCTGVLLLTLNWFLSRDTFCFWFPSG